MINGIAYILELVRIDICVNNMLTYVDFVQYLDKVGVLDKILTLFRCCRLKVLSAKFSG